MSDKRRRSCRSDVNLWLHRNVRLVAAATFVVIYGVFMVRTTMWTHSFGASQEQEVGQIVRHRNVRKEAVSVRKERGKYTEEEAAKQVEEAVEDRREQLVKKQRDNAYTTATTGLRDHTHRTENYDVALYDNKIHLEDAGDISIDGAMMNGVESAADTKKDHKWTALGNLSLSGEAEGDKRIAVPREKDYKEPTPLTASVVRTVNDSNYLWTGVDKLPEAREGIMQRVPGAILTVSTANQNATLAARIQPGTFMSRRFDKSRLGLAMSNTSIPFDKRHDTVFGYNATIAYLQLYTKAADSQEELFLFFTCSDSQGGQDDWTPNCAIARKKVYDTFAKSPSTNHLLTIHTGPREDWIGGNAFTADDDIRLKAIPTLLRWDGGAPGSLRSTWGVLVDSSIFDEPLLHYLFRNIDVQDTLLRKPDVETKDIVTLKGYAQYREYMDIYAQSGTPYPMYLMMVSGRYQHNNRLWCPWCRQSEMPVEYAFYAYAPTNAKLIIVETFNTYSEWRNPDNEFKKDSQLAMKGVPWFYRVYPSVPGDPLMYERIKKKFYVLEALQEVFESTG